jgi:DNA-binding response OmpR family regulator
MKTAKRVVIAEDEESILASLEFLVRRAGHESRSARDGNQALAAIEEFRPHLVLLDLMLPQKSGLEVCFAIRAHPQLQHTKVMMLTAKGGSNEVARGIAAGADDYVVKPFSTRELAERLKAMLEGADA